MVSKAWIQVSSVLDDFIGDISDEIDEENRWFEIESKDLEVAGIGDEAYHQMATWEVYANVNYTAYPEEEEHKAALSEITRGKKFIRGQWNDIVDAISKSFDMSPAEASKAIEAFLREEKGIVPSDEAVKPEFVELARLGDLNYWPDSFILQQDLNDLVKAYEAEGKKAPDVVTAEEMLNTILDMVTEEFTST